MKFIVLTTYDDISVIVNVDSINYYKQYMKGSCLEMTSSVFLPVKETPVEITLKINELK